MSYRFAWATILFAAALLAFVGCSIKDNNGSDTDSDSGNASNDETMKETDRPVRKYRFTYNVTVPVAEGTKELRVWVPLPMSDPGVQEVSDLTISAPEGHKQTSESAYGNKMVYVTVANPTEDVKISWTAVITRWQDQGQGTLPTQERYLQANKLIPVDGPARSAAEELGVTDNSLSLADRTSKIYYSVLDGMIYDKGGATYDESTGLGWGGGSFKHSIEICEGNCTDFHARFIGIGRAAGIPVRFTMGIPMKSDAKGTYNSYHCWAHWYDGEHWQPVDISEADKVQKKHEGDGYADRAQWFYGNLGEDRLAMSFGRDIVLEPAQAGAPLNYFIFPYAEADGQKVKMSKAENWLFEYENVE